MTRGIEISIGDHEGSILRSGRKYTPRGFSHVRMPREYKDFATRMAVETFALMVNNGHTFQDALTAVYLTGCDHAINARRDESDG